MKYVLFLADGMADEPMPELNGATPLMAADTPNFDSLALRARFGSFLSLPEGFPTSSDVANLSVLGYDLAQSCRGRGVLEAAAQGILLQDGQIAMRCNLVTATPDGILLDYSGGQVRNDEAAQLIQAMQDKFGSPEVRFHHGVSYRNLIILTGERFSPDFAYEKPDDHPNDPYLPLLPQAKGPDSHATVELLRHIILESFALLDNHPVNAARRARGEAPANLVWPWSPGRKPAMPPFREMYGKSGAIISAVDVIKGIGLLGGLDVIQVPGATGYIDTNYEGKALAGVEALKRHDFVYVHVEAIDEVSHAGNLKLKLRAIEDFDKRLVGTFLKAYEKEFGGQEDLALAVLPDHPVPLALRKHTRVPVPVMFVHPGVPADGGGLRYSELDAPKGSIGLLKGDGVMRTLFG